jgi:L-ascorbate metabolism protein UlaG (beta-lactamase superfamily)
MADEAVYLKPNVLLEPLVDQWYAWNQLISPATAAMNITERHLKIMDSYIRSPAFHASAVKNPALLGGPFIDYGGQRVAEIRALRDRTVSERRRMIALSEAIKELDSLLRTETEGFSLESLYPRVPELLRGFVELVYDRENHPSFRLIEPLLYRSDLYDDSTQSIACMEFDTENRRFALSTPRLFAEDDIHLRIPFADERLDALFRLEHAPQSLGFVREMLGLPCRMEDSLRQLLTPAAPQRYARYTGRHARWRYFGHACILVETATTSILTDPVVSYAHDDSIPHYTYADLPDFIDYVLITHAHQDHILLETLLRLRHRIGRIIVPRCGGGALQDPSLKLLLERLGFAAVTELDELEEIATPSGAITGLPFLGEHGDLDIRSKLAYRVAVDGHVLAFAADSRNCDPRLYQHLRRLLGPVDVLFIGMECDGAPLSWIYGPLLTRPLERKKDFTRKLSGSDYEQAIAVVDALGCKQVYVYAMGQEPWLTYVMCKRYTAESEPIVASDRLVRECSTRGIASQRLFGEREMLLDG